MLKQVWVILCFNHWGRCVLKTITVGNSEVFERNIDRLKAVFQSNKVNVINVPHYKELTVQDLLSLAELNVNILLSLEY